jgi:ABC-2 type transport system ATP-binding protein
MQLMADHLVVIAAGRMVADESLPDFVARSTRNDVLVRCTDPVALAAALAAEGLVGVPEGADGLAVTTSDTDRVGDVAFRAGVGVRELTRRTASLEEAFLELTSGDQQFRTGEAS